MNVRYRDSDDVTCKVMPATLNVEQTTNIIIEEAKKLVGQFIEQRGNTKPPFLAKELARFKKIGILKAELGKTSAVLLRFHDGHVIKVNQKHNLARQNFSIAHEIGHILFSDLRLETYTRNIEYRTYNPQVTDRLRDRARERLCNAAAAELLMPESVFRKYLSNFGVSIHAIERLANIFGVAIRATARRIAEVSEEPCIALFWQPQNIGRPLKLAWCTGPGITSTWKASYVPKHTIIRYPSTLYKAYENGSSVKSFKKFKRGTDVKRLLMESKGFGRAENRYVISLAFLDR